MSVTKLRPIAHHYPARKHTNTYEGIWFEENKDLPKGTLVARWSRFSVTIDWTNNELTLKDTIDQAIKEIKDKLIDKGISLTYLNPTKIEMGWLVWFTFQAQRKQGLINE